MKTEKWLKLKKLIQDVATDQGIKTKLTDQQFKQAHHYANLVPQDYYYRLKEFFYN